MSDDDFKSTGLGRLTEAEGNALFRWMLTNRPFFACGRSYSNEQKEELNHIHLYVEDGSGNSADFVGQLRSRLSAIQDVKLVYADSDADLILSVIALASKSKGGADIGYMASIQVLAPCTYKSASGYDAGASMVRKNVDSLLQVGPDRDAVLTEVASTLDVSDFDPVRKDHSETLKSYQ